MPMNLLTRALRGYVQPKHAQHNPQTQLFPQSFIVIYALELKGWMLAHGG